MNPPQPDRQRLAGIGLDIGGTKLAGVVIDPSGAIVARTRRDTPRGDGDAVIAACIESAAELLAVARSGGLAVGPIAIAMPGTIDTAGGTVEDSPVLSMHDVPMVEIAQRALGHPLTVLHDVKAAAFGELVAGAGIGQADVAYLNLGTGVSMAFAFGWKVHQGSTGTAGEIGHVNAVPNGPLCNCGRRGCLEMVASGPAIARAAGQTDGKLETVAEAARQGDQRALAALGEAAEHLGRILADFLMVMDVGMLMVGGGVSGVGAPLLDPLQASLDKHLNDVVESVSVVSAALGGDSGVIGAAHWSRLVHNGQAFHAW
ncbi:MAG: glucokinase [Ilumatobacteraceae bacterium]|nr:glucokinase [Ilumatobacteraceae bacterium]